jgi:site-specific DNA-methyltransferase (adenine-specific)
MMAALVWRGKNPPAEQPTPSLRTVETVGEGAWHNRLIEGDRAGMLRALLPEFAGEIDLIYIDPPFATGNDFVMADGDVAYRDSWPDVDDYLQWFYETLCLARPLLSETGSIYVHLAYHIGHYARIVLDEVFGRECFQNEIIWYYRTGGASRRRFARKHDNIFLYTKSPDAWTFSPQRERSYMMHRYGFRKSDFQVDAETGQQYTLVYARDVWDIPSVGSATAERVGYPTQKPERLLERIIRASSNENDLVLDCFVGSGTTAVVAGKLGRRWIVGDASPVAIRTTHARLLAATPEIPFVMNWVG